MKKAFKSALEDVKQATIDAWTQSLKTLISSKEAEFQKHKETEQKKQQLLTYLREAKEKGATLREMSQITGLTHTTIARWLNPEKYHYKRKKKPKEEQQHA